MWLVPVASKLRRNLRIGPTVVLVCVLTAGCGAALNSHSLPPSGGVLQYWTRHRLLGASPEHGIGYRAPRNLAVPREVRFGLASLRVGALFSNNGSGNHFCTASVVDSPGGNLLVTAAHCLTNGHGEYQQDVVFIPGYRDGEAPYGIWTAAKLIVAPEWIANGNPDFDVGFVILKRLDGKNIADVLGSNALGFDSRYRYLVRVTGYPNSAESPITCRNWTTRHSDTQLRFDCDDFTDGTSGSPWVTRFDLRTRNGTIVGVIGGYQQGGNTPSTSYSPLFGDAIRHLYEMAIHEEAGVD